MFVCLFFCCNSRCDVKFNRLDTFRPSQTFQNCHKTWNRTQHKKRTKKKKKIFEARRNHPGWLPIIPHCHNHLFYNTHVYWSNSCSKHMIQNKLMPLKSLRSNKCIVNRWLCLYTTIRPRRSARHENTSILQTIADLNASLVFIAVYTNCVNWDNTYDQHGKEQ